MDKKNSPQKLNTVLPTPATPQENPNVLVYNFLKANNLSIKLEAIEPDGGFLGDGFLLEKKPILKVVFVRN